ncbi:MAG: hypothetical protein DWQ37_22000 [Planctomycetota bacterium]|nr:MAG: hypothetical protein DWQ37_22000 [Planctomycetota bacterium]
MIGDLIGGVLTYFSMIMLVLAVGIAVAMARPWRKGTCALFTEELFRWVALLGAGAVGLYTAGMHIFFPKVSAEAIGWATSPFQFEVGMADLTIGVLSVLAFRAGLGFRAAATIAVTVFLGGDAVGHVRQMIVADNFAPGNAGPWFWSDVLVPAIMIGTLVELWRQSAKPEGSSPRGRAFDLAEPQEEEALAAV